MPSFVSKYSKDFVLEGVKNTATPCAVKFNG